VVSIPPGGGSATVQATLFRRLGELYETAREAARVLGITRGALLGETVFIKPNFVGLGILDGFFPESGECAKPEVVAAVAEQCLEAGAARVMIGDGAQGVRWPWESLSFLPGNTVHGAANLAAAVSWLNQAFGDRVELLCLNAVDRWRTIPSSSTDPLLQDGLRVAESFYDADHVISIPCLKSHQWAGLTASMKNLLGVTPLQGYQIMGEPSRGALHAAYAQTAAGGVEGAGIEGAYLDVFRWRKREGKQDFAILEGSIGLEGNGPHAWGDTPLRDLPGAGGLTVDFSRRTRCGHYFFLSSQDFVALDTVAAKIARYDWEELKYLVMARNLGLGETQRILLRGASLDELTMTQWKRAEQLEDWGAAPDAHAAVPGSDPARSRVFNHLLPLVCPTAIALLWRLWGRGSAPG